MSARSLRASYSIWSAVLLVYVLLLLLSVPAWAAPISAAHLKVDLVAQDASITPGHTFQAGLKFDLEKGWHVYWINPGDSGEPPTVEWKLPAGFEAGHGEVALSLPVLSDAAKPSADHDLFAKTKESLPRPAPRTWKQSALARKDGFVLTLRTGKQVANAMFFPRDEDQIENAAPQQVHSEAIGVHIDLKKSEQLLKPITRLRGVVLLDGKAYEIDAPVHSSHAARS